MKKILFHFICLGCAVLSIVGCATTAQTFGSVPVVYPEMYADLDVNTDNKLVATNTTIYLFGCLKISGDRYYADIPSESGSLFGRPGSLSRAAATYKAIENYDYDVIVAPNYRTVKTIGLFHLWVTYKTTMTGYGAKIKSLALADGQETDASSIQYTDTSEDIKRAKEAKKSGTQQNANPIFLTKNLELFESGFVSTAPRKDQRTLEEEFTKEIESNLSRAKNIDEYDFIKRKVDALKAYNYALESPRRDLKKAVEDFEQTIEKKVSRLSGSNGFNNAVNKIINRFGMNDDARSSDKDETEGLIPVSTNKKEDSETQQLSQTTIASSPLAQVNENKVSTPEAPSGLTEGIISSKIIDIFNSGEAKNASEELQERYEEVLINEIESNLKIARTSDDYYLILKQVEALNSYNESLNSPKRYLRNRYTRYINIIKERTSKLKK